MEKKFKIEAVQTSFCLFSCIELLAREYGWNVAAMYSSCPTFNIKCYEKGTFPELRLSFAKSPIDICREYLSFEVNEVSIPCDVESDEFVSLLQKNFPCITCIDAYICPWTKFYKKKHISHYIILLSLDKDDYLVCCDPFITDTQQKLLFDDYFDFWRKNEDLLMYEFKRMYKLCKTDNLQLDIINELAGTARYILKNHMLEDMDLYIKILQNDVFIIKDNVIGFHLDNGFLDLLTVGNTRKDFFKALAYSYSINGKCKLKKILDEYENLLEMWESLEQSVLFMSLIKDAKRRQNILFTICERLNAICVLEKKINYALAAVDRD